MQLQKEVRETAEATWPGVQVVFEDFGIIPTPARPGSDPPTMPKTVVPFTRDHFSAGQHSSVPGSTPQLCDSISQLLCVNLACMGLGTPFEINSSALPVPGINTPHTSYSVHAVNTSGLT